MSFQSHVHSWQQVMLKHSFRVDFGSCASAASAGLPHLRRGQGRAGLYVGILVLTDSGCRYQGVAARALLDLVVLRVFPAPALLP